MPRPSKYPEQFRLDAVELARSSRNRSLREIGRELGVNHETLRGWVNAANRAEHSGTGRGERGGELSAGERDELRRLRSKVAELELEKEIGQVVKVRDADTPQVGKPSKKAERGQLRVEAEGAEGNIGVSLE